MDNIELRKATLEDLNKGLLEAYIDGYRFHQKGRPDVFNIESDEVLKNKIIKDFDRLEIIVSTLNDEVTGYISYEIKEKTYKKMYIDQLAVRNCFKKQGFGKLLMSKVKEIAASEGCKRIEFNCWMFNESAQGMYEHLGFQKQRIMYEMKIDE